MTVPDAESWSLRAPERVARPADATPHDARDPRPLERTRLGPTPVERVRGAVLLAFLVVVLGVVAAVAIGGAGAAAALALFRFLTG